MKFKITFLAVSILLSASWLSSTFAQKVDAEQDFLAPDPDETWGDAYLPNAFGDQKTTPGYRRQGEAMAKTTATAIVTVQTNVNGLGQNIVGDAANESNIAINPLDPNHLLMGWRQFDNVASNFRQAGWAYSTDAGLNWTFAGKIQAGIFRSDPVLDYDGNGVAYYNSLTLDSAGNYTCQIFISTNDGLTWDNGTEIGGGDKQWMAIDRTGGAGDGNIYSAWSSIFSACPPNSFTRSTDGGNSYESCTSVQGDPFRLTMAVTNAGELFIAGEDINLGTVVVSKSTNVQNAGSVIAWQTPIYVDLDGNLTSFNNINPQGLGGQTNVDVDRSNGPGQNNVYVLASIARTSTGDPADIMFARSTDGGLTWSLPQQINDDISNTNTQWFGTMSVAPNGRIDAVWLDTRDAFPGSDYSALYYAYSTDQGHTWSANEKLSDAFDPHVGYPNQNKMGDYFDMVSDNVSAHLAWTNTLNGEQDVYYSRITPSVISGNQPIGLPIAISVAPNPSQGHFTISGLEESGKLEIFNLLGEMAFTSNRLASTMPIDISMQPAGIYLLKWVDGNGRVQTKRLVKK